MLWIVWKGSDADTTKELSRLWLSEAQFMIFRNAAHDGLNVVYRRPDGHIGWIDAEPKTPAGANGVLKATGR